jgi:glucuronate isomerase
MLGKDMENGQLPADEKLIGTMISDICFDNAANYLGLPSVPPNAKLAKS